MARRRGEKKSESLEVRLPFSVKRALMETARTRGETASEVVRRSIRTYLAPPRNAGRPATALARMARYMPSRKKTLAMAAALAAGAFAFTTLNTASAEDEAFKALDENGDGRLTPGEIAPDDGAVFDALDQDRSGDITPDEFQPQTTIVTVSDMLRSAEGERDVRIIEVKRTEIDLSTPGTSNVSITSTSEEIDLAAGDAAVDALVVRLKRKIDAPRDAARPPGN